MRAYFLKFVSVWGGIKEPTRWQKAAKITMKFESESAYFLKFVSGINFINATLKMHTT